jgi:DNA modification methylase
MKLDDLPQPTEETVVSPEQLEVDGENPNEQSDAMFGLLCDNMRQKGWLGNAIIADTDGLIADGEHRWRAAQEIGLEEVPVKFYEIDDAERRLWRQELNKISGEHDKKRDALEYQELLDAGKSDDVDDLVNATGEDLDELLAELRVDRGIGPQYEYDPDHNVYFEDCVEGMRERLDDDSVDMVFTSPPYNVGKDKHEDRESEVIAYDDSRSLTEFQEFMSEVCRQLARVTKPSGHIFVNIDNPYSGGDIDLVDWIVEMMPLPLRSYIVWQKPTFTKPQMPERGQYHPDWEPIFHFSSEPSPLKGNPDQLRNVWEYPTAVVDGDYGEHPAPFPKALPERAINTTTSKGDTILDPFMGSGTTAVAAIQNNREYVGFELDEKGAYKPIIERRISEAKRQMSGNQG